MGHHRAEAELIVVPGAARAEPNVGTRLAVLVSEDTNPRVNLRLEDTLLQEVESGQRPDTLRLWVNDVCLVRGANRSDSSGWHRAGRARVLGVPILRRKTGGGSVYHDPGNLNWSFYLRRAEGYLAGSRLHQEWGGWIVERLRELGIDAAFVAPNRLDASGRKISGMASRATFGAVLVHGTLLVATDLERLNQICVPPPGCPPVTNLGELIPGLTVERLTEHLVEAARRVPYWRYLRS